MGVSDAALGLFVEGRDSCGSWHMFRASSLSWGVSNGEVSIEGDLVRGSFGGYVEVEEEEDEEEKRAM